jgi:LacI family transcriptional regulator
VRQLGGVCDMMDLPVKAVGADAAGAGDSSQVRPTLKTIAAETGLAIATVSRALKDAPDIGEDTKRRVRDAAERMGYRPNRAGVRLRTGKTNVIALVMSTEPDVMNITSRLIYSVAYALRGTSYHMVMMPYYPDQDPMEPIRYLVETGSADGIIMNQTQPDDPRVRYLIERGVPFATHGRTMMGIRHTWFDFDNAAYGRLGAEALAARGRRRLLLVQPPPEHTYALHMSRAFADRAAALGATVEILSGATSDSPSATMEAALVARLGAPDRPDGILVGSTTAAMCAVSAGEGLGLAVGRDFDIVAKEAIPVLRRFRPAIMIVSEDIGRAGAFLTQALIDRIDHGLTEPAEGLDVPDHVELGPETT